MSEFIGSYKAGAMGRARLMQALLLPYKARLWTDHFDSVVASVDTARWNVTCGSSATIVHSTTVSGGVWTMTAPASGTSTGCQLQTFTPLVTPAINKVSAWETRLKIDVLTANYGAVFFGGQDVADTTLALPCTSAGVATASIDVCGMAIKADGTVVSVVQNGSTTGAVQTLGTLVADTYYQLGFEIRGTEKVVFYIDGVIVGEVTTSGAIPNEALYGDLGVLGGTSGGKVCNADYFWFACEV